MSSAHSSNSGFLAKFTELSMPLILGVVAALIAANVDHHWYHGLVDGSWGFAILGHDVNLHWFANDIFMVFFFGIAAKEITDAVLPGGALSPFSKAINPLFGTIGGVLGPVGVYLAMTYMIVPEDQVAAVANGWAVPTATDIALAWLVARLVFGATHPAVSFLLLLAIADDAIGLGIIAVAYPDPEHPVQISGLLWVLAGMVTCFGMRKAGIRSWPLYILVGGGLSWFGLLSAYLHPALALVPIVPFLPKHKPATGLIGEDEEGASATVEHVAEGHGDSPLDDYEHTTKPYVDWGLFLFAFANAGVEFANIGAATWIVLASLVIGKTVGITAFSWVGSKLGFALPEGMELKHLTVAGLVAGLGLTVALFVCGVAFPGNPVLTGEAKMGALFSIAVFLLAIVIGRAVGIKPIKS